MIDGASKTSGWEFWIDRGGTFTDIVARRPDGALFMHKLLSENPERYRDAATQGIRELLHREGEGDAKIAVVKMGTTVATNALLERKGAPTLLAITAGHGDALRIGTQHRPRLFDRHIVLPEMLYGAVIEIDERVSASGDVLVALNLHAAQRALRGAYEAGYRAVAIVLVHGYRYPAHEQQLAALAREIGYTQISVSHEVSPLIKLVGRGDTTVVDAYLTPVLRHYVERVAGELGTGPRLLFMQSNGGLVDAQVFRGKDAVLSGPAGGIVGMVRSASAAGFEHLIGFDMGGTSTDVSHYAGVYERSYETAVAGVRLRAPMLDLHTIAAGGGSICRFDGARLRVGPESAGAVPGPACYRRGGPLTITDCNLLLGKLQPAFFPAVFGPQGDEPLDRQIVVTRFAALADEIFAETGQRLRPVELAEGFLRIAVENMARAIKQISTQRGHDLGLYTLVCFGGAGGQHAGLVADALGLSRVMIHPLAGVLSAYGMGLADLRTIREATVAMPLIEANAAQFTAIAERLSLAARQALLDQAVPFSQVTVSCSVQLRYAGTDTGLNVTLADIETMRAAFESLHRRQFGFASVGTAVIVELMSAEAVGSAQGGLTRLLPSDESTGRQSTIDPVEVCFDGKAQITPIHARDALACGSRVEGPALICETTGTTIVEPGWQATVDAQRNLILERTSALQAHRVVETQVDPVQLEVFNSRFMAVAERMGYALQNTASSVNIKERLDFSCALFSAAGDLIANAPHIPVHLGSMGDSVRAIRDRRRETGQRFRRGDVYMLNAPYNGGTHLPDITVVMPIFSRERDQVIAYVAARGHHADIGGITPGSMPPLSRSVEDEGVLIEDFLLVEQGRFREIEIRALLASGPWPARNPDQNLADLKAQVAACAKGADELQQMIAVEGLDVVSAYMQHVQDNAEAAVRQVLGTLRDGQAEVAMDDGAVIRVAITVDREQRRACVDFTGSSAQRPNNFNAPVSICRAAVLYVFRTLVDDDIPLNDGCLRPIELIVPRGSMLNPEYPAAVVAGNVETSQAVTDALYAALGIMAGAQGTMNNFSFGDATRQYYETICGGSGAGPGFDGASAVQTHMTNSRLTDVEVLESRFPVLVEHFAIRRGSGGEGSTRGGDGVERRLRFREPMTAAILSNRRRVPPQGLVGGKPAAAGCNTVERADGRVETLSATAVVEMQAHDAITIATPGGGGYGPPAAERG